MTKLINALSLNMIEEPAHVVGNVLDLRAEVIDLNEARSLAKDGIESFVGHPDTAALFAEQLGVPVSVNRGNVILSDKVTLLGQYKGPRLPEGTKTLPPGAKIVWYKANRGVSSRR